ncbi:MAG: LamG domain-containing protein [Deltaproteobacteria bacterium]|nr:LamG domain-containing protein [Deltaproteobacteria bacterium]
MGRAWLLCMSVVSAHALSACVRAGFEAQDSTGSSDTALIDASHGDNGFGADGSADGSADGGADGATDGAATDAIGGDVSTQDVDAGASIDAGALSDAGPTTDATLATEWRAEALMFNNTQISLDGTAIQLATWSDAMRRLPDDESQDLSVDMLGNKLLLHFEGPTGAPLADGVTIENSATTGLDAVAHSRDGRGLEFVDGILGQALSFNAGDDSIDVFGASAGIIEPEFTVAFWIRMPSLQRTELFADGAASTGFHLSLLDDGNIDWTIFGATDATVVGHLRPDVWQHVAFIYNRGAVQVYYNGASWQVLAGEAPGIQASMEPWTLGRHFVGAVDEVAVWSRALSEAELEAIYQRARGVWGGDAEGTATSPPRDYGASGPARLSWGTRSPYGKPLLDDGALDSGYPEGTTVAAGVRGLWHFDGLDPVEDGKLLPDASGNQRHGTARSPDWPGFGASSGLFGDGLCFDGLDDYVDLPPEVIEGLSEYSFSTWIFWRGNYWPAPESRHWQRILDFGESVLADATTGEYIFLTPMSNAENGEPGIHYATSLAGYDTGDAMRGIFPVRVKRWTHVAVVAATDLVSVYVDGDLYGQMQPTLHPLDIKIDEAWLGRSHFGSELDPPLFGCLDEVALWGRPLAPDEVSALHRRGAVRVSVQLRACDIAADCDALPFVGPDGTEASVFEEPRVQPTPGPPSFDLPTLFRKRFVQYRLRLRSTNARVTPEVVWLKLE